MFDGFSKELPKFLGRLARNNNRDWFEKNRSTYESVLLEPAREFVMAMDENMRAISPDINVEPRVNATIRRINRDVRFSKDKRPYKDHLDFFFRYRDAGKEGPGYFLRVREKDITLGSGIWMFDRGQLPTYRDAVDADGSGKALASVVMKLERAGYVVGPEHYKRVPRGYDSEHERGRLLRFSGLHTWTELKTPKEMFSPSITTLCAKHFRKTAPLAEWIVEHMGGTQ